MQPEAPTETLIWAEPFIIAMIFDSSWWFSVKTTKENKKQNRIKIRRGTRKISILSNVCHRIQCDYVSAERFDIWLSFLASVFSWINIKKIKHVFILLCVWNFKHWNIVPSENFNPGRSLIFILIFWVLGRLMKYKSQKLYFKTNIYDLNEPLPCFATVTEKSCAILLKIH